MGKTFQLTKQNFQRLKNVYERNRSFRCPKCHKPFKIGDEIVHVGVSNFRYFHLKCLKEMAI